MLIEIVAEKHCLAMEECDVQILQTIILLYYWRANTVGVNQVKTEFMPHLNQDVDQYIINL